MNKYLLLKHGAGPSEGWDEYFKMLRDGGHLIGGSALDHGISVKAENLSPPLSETLTGYILIQAEDLETAQGLARQSPVHQAGGAVEVFTLVVS